MAERITERRVRVADNGQIVVDDCPRGHIDSVGTDGGTWVTWCKDCADWRHFRRNGDVLSTAVGANGMVATATRCAHPVPCSECGCEGDCGRGT